MRHIKGNFSADKCWYAGPWESDLGISVGFANVDIDQPHKHTQITEIYLVVDGTAQIQVEQDTITLKKGDVLIVQPYEAHTFLSSSDDYHHVVIHTPGLQGEAAKSEKILL